MGVGLHILEWLL